MTDFLSAVSLTIAITAAFYTLLVAIDTICNRPH